MDAEGVDEGRDLHARGGIQVRDQRAAIDGVGHDPGRLAGGHRRRDRGGVFPASFDLEAFACVELADGLGVLIEVVGDPIQVLADWHVEPVDGVAGGVPLADVPGVVLRVMLRRFGRVEAEAPKQVRTDQVVAGNVPRLDEGAQARVDVAAVVLESHDEREVVQSGAVGRQVLAGDAQIAGQPIDRPEDGVAQSDDSDRGRLGDRPHQDRQRVGVVEQPRVGADVFHVAGDGQHDGDGAKPSEHAADADRVGDRVAESEPGGYVEVDPGGPGATDLDRVDDELGALQRLAPVEVGRHGRVGTQRIGRPVRHAHGGAKSIRIDVVQRDVRGPQRRGAQDVSEQVAREFHAAGTDEDDPCHSLS